jgi:acetyl-CoA synthetase
MIDFNKSYTETYAHFSWSIPEFYNIGVDVCDRHAANTPEKIALIWAKDEGDQHFSYGYFKEKSDRLANLLRSKGVKPGDRVALILAQGPAAVISHIALYKLNAIAVPLAVLFGPDALNFRLSDSGASVVIANDAAIAKIAFDGLILSVDKDFYGLIEESSPDFTPVNSRADDPALMIYTSGTTGQPKGALHAHRVLLGHLPGVQMPHDGFPLEGDLMWTPADWAWAGGLLNILLPALYYGVPVLAKKFEKFDPDEAFALMANYGVKNTFIPPTALRMLRTVENPRAKYNLSLRTIGSGGESLGEATFHWGEAALGVTINEFYGQTECNLVLASSKAWGVVKPGAIGKAVPGHRVIIIDEMGIEVPRGTPGQIAIFKGDPVMFLRYWNNEQATRDKYIGDWLITGDQGIMDAEGFVTFHGRDDDIITSSGYRIGPTEIEDCLIKHEAVALAAVIGKPDVLRTEIVKAFVVLKKGVAESDTLKKDIQTFVRERVSSHAYPREIEFIESLPMTTTGKIIRRLLKN